MLISLHVLSLFLLLPGTSYTTNMVNTNNTTDNNASLFTATPTLLHNTTNELVSETSLTEILSKSSEKIESTKESTQVSLQFDGSTSTEAPTMPTYWIVAAVSAGTAIIALNFVAACIATHVYFRGVRQLKFMKTKAEATKRSKVTGNSKKDPFIILEASVKELQELIKESTSQESYTPITEPSKNGTTIIHMDELTLSTDLDSDSDSDVSASSPGNGVPVALSNQRLL